jgi:glycine/D-amino acid oxidase-like deaminating enzyme
MRDLTAQATEVATDYGVLPLLHDPADLAARGMAGPWHGGLTIPLGFGLHPRRYLRGLLGAARAAGAVIHGATPVTRIDPGAPHLLHTPHGTVTADRLIIATNGYSSEDLPPWLAARFMPAQSNVIMTRPLTMAEQRAGWHSDQMSYDTRRLLHYFRLLPDGRFQFGMRGGVLSSPAADRAMARQTRAHFDRLFPMWRHVETPWDWSGMVSLAAHGAPYVGPVPGLDRMWTALSYHGNGVAMATFAGTILADLAHGATPPLYPALMRDAPPRIPLGRFRRVAMPFAYAARAITDRL